MLGDTPLEFFGGNATFPVELGENGVSLDITDGAFSAAANPRHYDIVILRGGFSSIFTTSGAPNPGSDPTILEYSYTLDGWEVDVGVSASSFLNVTPGTFQPTGLVPGNNVVQFELRTLQNDTLVDTYTLNIDYTQHVFGTYIPSSSTYETQAVVNDGEGNARRNTPLTSAPYLAGALSTVAAMAQRPGSRDVFFAHNAGVSVATLSPPDGALVPRARVAAPMDDSDYLLPIGFAPTAMAFHPSGQSFYLWDEAGAQLYRVPLTNLGVGNGFPETPVAVGATLGSHPARILVSNDGTTVLVVLLLATGSNVGRFTVSAADGSLVSDDGPTAVGSSPLDAAFDRTSTLLFAVDGADVVSWLRSDVALGSPAPVGSAAASFASEVQASPTFDFVHTIESPSA